MNSRLSLIQNATKTCGGLYLYANHRGCDGTRLYFDGSALISLNGDILQQASQFSLNDVEVITAVVDLNDIRSHRHAISSLQEQCSESKPYPLIDLQFFSLTNTTTTNNTTTTTTTNINTTTTNTNTHTDSTDCYIKNVLLPITKPIPIRLHTPEEECAYGR